MSKPHNFLISLLLLATATAYADIKCREDKLLKVSVESNEFSGQFSGKICWKKQYFVTGFEIPRDTIMYFKDPHVTIGYRGLNGSFMAKRKIALTGGWENIWCRAIGYQFGVHEDVGESLTEKTILRPEFDRQNQMTSLTATRTHGGEYADGIYCSNTAISIFALSVKKARQDGTLGHLSASNLPKTIYLSRQK
jgi:hypothetical protein